MTKAEQKKYFAERKAQALERSKKSDMAWQKLIRNMKYQYEKEQKEKSAEGNEEDKSFIELVPRVRLGKNLIR